MKTIGMLGGMSWESTAVYYRLMNREVQERLGGVHSAKALMYSFDFDQIAVLQTADKWNDIADLLNDAATGLARGGADFLMICCNTQHLVAAEIERAVCLPLLHIADPLGDAIAAKGIRRAGLIGTRYTMEKGGVIADRLKQKFGVEIVIPEDEDRAEVHRIIFDELSRGKFLEPSRVTLGAVMERLVARGAEGVILGCTELPMLVEDKDASVPLFNTTALHAMAAVAGSRFACAALPGRDMFQVASDGRMAAGPKGLEESPGSTKDTVTDNIRRGRPQGQRHRNDTAYRPKAAARLKWCGKSAPRLWQQRWHGKPHREQDQIGTAGDLSFGSPSGSVARGGR